MESLVPDAEAANEPFPAGLPPTVPGDPPAHIPAPLRAVPPPREVRPPREIFDPILPIDLLSLAEHADPESARLFSTAVHDLQDLFKKRSPPQPSPPSTVCLADVPARGVEWLWPGRVPIGKITLLVGDPGVGKSLIALDIAARVTTGKAWPEQQPPALPGVFEPRRDDQTDCATTTNSATISDTATDPRQSRGLPGEHARDVSQNSELRPLNPPGSVLLLSAEDDLADTIRPRLEALDADCTRVIALVADNSSHETRTTGSAANASAPESDVRHSGIRGSTRILDLGRDVAILDRLLDSRPDCSLVIIDPISAYLGRAVENVNAEVRRIIAPLADLAARRRLALVVISHLRKQGGAAIHRSIGSLAFVAAARTAWLVCKDSPTKDRYTPQRRLLLPIKNNITGDATGLACSIETHPYAGLPIVSWSNEPLDVDADEALTAAKASAGRPADDRDEAARWLETQLADGPRPAAEVKEFASAHGFNQDTLHRAFRHLGGRAVRAGFGPGGQWSWSLPGKQAP